MQSINMPLSYFLLASVTCSITLLFQCPKTSATFIEMAKPGCPDRCGQTIIPYPFGINRGCYLDETFEVTCNVPTGSVSLAILPWEIDEISASTHTFRHKNFSALPLMFDQSGENLNGHALYMTLVTTRYGVSHERNVFFATGCDFYVYIIDEETNEFQGGCASLCNNDMFTTQSPTCSGMHCCQISFARDLNNLTVGVETMNTVTKSWASKCGFFGFVDKDYLLNETDFSACNGTYLVPIIHNWAVGNTTCAIAREKADYVCGENTNCVDYTLGVGYRCLCNNGYQGNPYLASGCQDINECADPKDNNCRDQSLCANTAGSYYCLPDRRHMFIFFIPLGVGLALGLLTLVIGIFWAVRKLEMIKEKKTKERFFKKHGGLLLEQQMFLHGERLLHDLTIFGIEELKKATDDFNENRVLGKGGLGTVYKGMLSDGRIVAVKKANLIDDRRVDQFINEVFILSQINHRHIVRLLGCCLESEVPLLAYEFISNGTLSGHLHNTSNSSELLSWENRLRIASEVAGALAYMHSYASTPIIHRDVKSNNILLDENYRAVVSDFGLSKPVSIDRTHLTTIVRGTFGYMDPEYFRSGKLNDKSDVYAFGVVLAEILTGERAVSFTDGEQGLAIRFPDLTENCLFESLERAIIREEQRLEVMAVADLAKRCLKTSARKRPSMTDASAELVQIRKMKGCLDHREESCYDHEYRSMSARSFSYVFHSQAEDDQRLLLTK